MASSSAVRSLDRPAATDRTGLRSAHRPGRPLHLRPAGVSVVLDLAGDRLPRVLHSGADLGDVPAAELAELRTVSVPPLTPDSTDAPVPVSVLPEQSLGWLGTLG